MKKKRPGMTARLARLFADCDSLERRKTRKTSSWSFKRDSKITGSVTERIVEQWRKANMVEVHEGVDYEYAYPIACEGCGETGVPLDMNYYCEECEEECELCGDRKRRDEMSTENVCNECANPPDADLLAEAIDLLKEAEHDLRQRARPDQKWMERCRMLVAKAKN